MGPLDFSGMEVIGDPGKGSLIRVGLGEAEDGEGKVKATLLTYFSIEGSRLKGATAGKAYKNKGRFEDTCNSRFAH